MIDPITKAPSLNPQVTIAGVTYTLKFSILAEYHVDELGLDLKDFIIRLRGSNTGTFAGFVKLFAAMVAHHFIALNQTPPTPAQWAAAIDKEPEGKVKEVCSAVAECLMGKMRASSAVALQETAPTQGPALN